MELHEHQVKELLKAFDVPVPEDASARGNAAMAPVKTCAAVLIDRKAALPALMVSPEGGTRIEEVAARNPERILKLHFDPAIGLWPYQARRAAWFLGLSGDAFESALVVFPKLCEAFVKSDAQFLEVNPLSVCNGRLLCLNATISRDPNALYRQPRG